MSAEVPRGPGRRRAAGIAFLIFTVELIACLAADTYVKHENFIYNYDTIIYNSMTSEKAVEFVESPVNALRGVKYSMWDNYNEFFTLPLVPLLLLAGDRRAMYIVGTTAFYLVPFVLAASVVATRLMPSRRGAPYVTLVVALLTPMVWVATLRGYPDMGAAAIMALAVWVYLGDPRLTRARQSVVIGVLLAGAMLFRRHFAYNAVALVLSVALQSASQAVASREGRGPRPVILELLRRGAHIALIGVMVVATLALIASPFLRNLLLGNYYAQYRSFKVPVGVAVGWFAAQFGLLTCLLSALGYTLGMATRTVDRTAAGFLCLFGVISFVEWVAVPGQLGWHYAAHFNLPLVLGLSCLVCTVWARLRGIPRLLTLGAIGISLAWGVVVGLTRLTPYCQAGAPAPEVKPPIPALFPAQNGPLVQHDMAEIARLIDYLRARATREDQIYVVTSFHCSGEIFRRAEQRWYGRDGSRLTWVRTPWANSGGFYPNGPLSRSRFVLVGNPWLDDGLGRRAHDVVVVVHDAFMNGGLLAEDFERLPVRFQLDWGVTVYVYERVRSTSLEKFARALALMEEEIRPRPGGQDDWIILPADPKLEIRGKVPNSESREINSFRLRGRIFTTLRKLWKSMRPNDRGTPPDSGLSLYWDQKLGPGAELADLVYLGALPETFRVTGRVAVPPGIEVTLRVMTLDAKGEIVHSSESRRVDAGTTDLSDSFARKGAQFVAVEVRARATGHISTAAVLNIAHLAVEPDLEAESVIPAN